MHGYKSQNDTLLLEKKKENTNKRRNMKWEQFGLVRNENGQPIKYEFLIEISYQFPNIKKKKKKKMKLLIVLKAFWPVLSQTIEENVVKWNFSFWLLLIP